MAPQKNLQKSFEDRIISRCLKEIGISPLDTADKLGSQRFLGFNPSQIMSLEFQRGYFLKQARTRWARIRNETSGILANETLGISVMSEALTGFHTFRQEHQLRRVHALLYPGTCPPNSSVENALKTLAGH